MAYLVTEPLFSNGVEIAGHTHAFDVYTNPFTLGCTDLADRTNREIVQHWGNHEFGGSPILDGMLLLGGLFIVLDKWNGLNTWLTSANSETSLDRVLSSGVMVTVSIASLVAMSVVGCYFHYSKREIAMLPL